MLRFLTSRRNGRKPLSAGRAPRERQMDRRVEGRRWSGGFGARGCAVLLACLGLALTLGLVAPSAASRPLFAGPRSYATGGGPVTVAIGDLNGDGKPDLATANYDADTVSVFANRDDGSFRAGREYATGSGSVCVAIGDLNGDGRPDLATANYISSTVYVLTNRSDGSFGERRGYRTGKDPRSVAIGDLNG